MGDELYLEEGFDPISLTMPKLRSILVAHAISYPSSAKKNDLVTLFNENVRPQARQIRSANARVRRTSRGIENVPSSQSTVDEDEDVESDVPAPARGSRRSTRAKTEEVDDVTLTPRRSRHSTAPPEAPTPRRASSKHARPTVQEEDEVEPEVRRPAAKKSRVSTATPGNRTRDDESPFSNANVFQSGGSPPAPAIRTADPERRRTTLSTSKDLERRSRELRRRTDEIKPVREQVDGAVVPTRRTFDMPVARVKREEFEPTEEFTPEEQQDLTQSQQSGELVTTRRKPSRPASSAAKTAPWAVSIAMMLGLATVWRQEKVEVGYCGVGRHTTELAGVHVPDWADFIRPQCEPCPPHAYCGEKLETVCEQDFVQTPHPLTFGGLIPLPPSCEPDSAKARKVGAVKERAVEELRVQNAKYECGEAAKPAVTETELKKVISTRRRKGMSNEEFDDLWEGALGEIQRADEVVSGSDGSSAQLTLRSTSLARLPLTCAIRRSLRETLRHYLWQLVTLLVALSGAGYGRYALTSGRETEKKAKQLASLALEKLSQQAALHAYDAEVYGEGFISVSQLRDDCLREEFGVQRRKALWEVVQRKVEGNSNVRAVVREGRSGDVGRCWEWVGAVGMIESPPGSALAERRKSGRISYGGEGVQERDGGEMSQVKKWDEGGQGRYY